MGNFLAFNIANVFIIEQANKPDPNSIPILYSTAKWLFSTTSEVIITPASSARTRIVIAAKS